MRAGGLFGVFGLFALRLVAVTLVVAAGGCQKPNATITFDVLNDGDLAKINHATLLFHDPNEVMKDKPITRSNLPRSLDLLLPSRMTEVSIQVDACQGDTLLLTGAGDKLPVGRQMHLALLAPTTPGVPCPSPDAGTDVGADVVADADIDVGRIDIARPDAGPPDTGPTDLGRDDPPGTDVPPCDDGGTDSGNCPNFADTPDGAVTVDAGTISADCVTYCHDMDRDCPGEYPGITECQAYCAQSGWAISDPNAVKDSLHCRQVKLAMVAVASPPSRPSLCAAAGPNGGGQGIMCANSVCQSFCDGWASLCDPDATMTYAECQVICLPPEASCRLKWLVLAAIDRRYCGFATIGSHCGGCPSPP